MTAVVQFDGTLPDDARTKHRAPRVARPGLRRVDCVRRIWMQEHNLWFMTKMKDGFLVNYGIRNGEKYFVLRDIFRGSGAQANSIVDIIITRNPLYAESLFYRFSESGGESQASVAATLEWLSVVSAWLLRAKSRNGVAAGLDNITRAYDELSAKFGKPEETAVRDQILEVTPQTEKEEPVKEPLSDEAATKLGQTISLQITGYVRQACILREQGVPEAAAHLDGLYGLFDKLREGLFPDAPMRKA